MWSSHLASALLGCMLFMSQRTLQYPIAAGSPSAVNGTSASNATSECDAECLRELLPLMARQGAASGIWKTLNAYNAVDWCSANANCTPVIEKRIDIIADNIFKVLPGYIYTDCNDLCVFEAGLNATNFAMSTSIVWMSNLVARRCWSNVSSEVPDSVAKLQWLRYMIGMEHNNFTLDYDMLNAPERDLALFSRSHLRARSRHTERDVRDVWDTLKVYWLELWDRMKAKFERVYARIFTSRDGWNLGSEEARSKYWDRLHDNERSVSWVSVQAFEEEFKAWFEEIQNSRMFPDKPTNYWTLGEGTRWSHVETIIDKLDPDAQAHKDWVDFKARTKRYEWNRKTRVTKEYAAASRRDWLADELGDEVSFISLWSDLEGRVHSEANVESDAGSSSEERESVRTVETDSSGSSIASQKLRDIFSKIKRSAKAYQEDDLVSLGEKSPDLRWVLYDGKSPRTRYVTTVDSNMGQSSKNDPGNFPKDNPDERPPQPPRPEVAPDGDPGKPSQPQRHNPNDPSAPESAPKEPTGPSPAEPKGPPQLPEGPAPQRPNIQDPVVAPHPDPLGPTTGDPLTKPSYHGTPGSEHPSSPGPHEIQPPKRIRPVSPQRIEPGFRPGPHERPPPIHPPKLLLRYG